MHPELVGAFEASITKVFAGYIKTHGGELPTNIATIANTEVRAAVSDIKHQYAEHLVAANDGQLKVVKRWVHHANLSDEPRPGHERMDGKEVAFDKPFTVPVIRKVGNKFENQGSVQMMHPHDTGMPAEEVINCHCECDYLAEVVVRK
jgi:hypothetical protein